MTLIKKLFIILPVLITAFWGHSLTPVYGAEVEIPSSLNPVGSGARALGMGGAFIAVADDATAASWNPGGLIQVERPEFSIVTSRFHREEDIDFEKTRERGGSYSVSEKNINYLSATYPFQLFRYSMAVSLNYQHLYDFTREWKFRLTEEAPDYFLVKNRDYQQKGRLTALGLAYCVQMNPSLSAGFTLNFWDDDLTDNHWKQTYQIRETGTIMGGLIPVENEMNATHTYSFKGFNCNLGVLWSPNYRLSLGAVLKTPFKADVEHKSWEHYESSLMPPESIERTENETLEMPMSYGVGMVYKFSDDFYVSADIYRTEWGDYVSKGEDGIELCPISRLPMSESDVDATHQIRLGAEYLAINSREGYVVPVRAGLFYDPAPAEGSPDNIYGFSLGLGLTRDEWFSLDIAYQYRFGNDIGKSNIFQDRGFSQDLDEHTVHVSVIYFF